MEKMEGLPGGCNPADVLYKLAHSRGIKAPQFEQISEQGPPHAKTFTWSCTFMDEVYKAAASGRSKKDARNAAAKGLIQQLDMNALPQRAPKNVGRGGGGPRGGGAGKRKIEGASEEVGGLEMMNGGGGLIPAKKKNKKGGRGGPINAMPLMSAGSMNPNMFMPPFGPMGGFGPGRGFGNVWGPDMGYGMDFGGPVGGMEFGGPMDMPFAGRPYPRQQRPTIEDKHVLARHEEVYPKEEELKLILKLVSHTEEALKKVSDKLFESQAETEVKEEGEEKKKTESESKEERELMGVARVGELAKGLLLSGDRSVNLVVMCRSKPTVSLLGSIKEALAPELKEVAGEENKYEIHVFAEEGGFCVVSMEGGSDELPYAVNVTLTSTSLRKPEVVKKEKKDGGPKDKGFLGELASKMEEEESKIKEVEKEKANLDPPDMLPKEKCLQALAELRHSKWFQSMASPVPSCVEAIRVFRDLAQRVPAWASLGDWPIELLVERALFSANIPLPPAEAMLRILEVMASGLALVDGSGLRDPCEREDVDVFLHLSVQEREDVTHSAQDFVRKIHYRKIHEVLGMERLPPPEKKKWPKKEKKEEEVEVEKKETEEVKEEKV